VGNDGSSNIPKIDLSQVGGAFKELQEKLKDIKIPTSMPDLMSITQPDFSYIMEQNEEMNREMEKFHAEKERKEAQRDKWLRTIAENVLAIKNNSDNLILSIDDLIQTVVVSNKITEANLMLIEQLIEKIKGNGELNKIDEIKKATLGLATQKGLEVGFVFLLKALGIL
jgi:hypothetical protein